ncbi:MAG: hypothetical protein KGI37_07760 [Alphaproteobacteria bacterium]|nr:hypothetical protein [Alphaproteobacteria bacterium]
MDSNFRLNITAVDKATAVVRHVKDAFGKVTRPVEEVHKSLASLGHETGLDKIGKTLFDIGYETSSIADKMAGVLPVLGGGIGVGALVEETAKWAEMGTELKRTSAIIGVTTSDLQTLRGAAKLADIEPQALDNSLKSLGTTMEDVFYYRAAPQAIAAMTQMGIVFHKTASGAPDIQNGLMQIADAVERLHGNPYAQETLLKSLGLSADILPLLEQGSEGLKKFREEFEKTKAVLNDQDIQKANDLRNSFVLLGDAVQGWAMRHISAVGDVAAFNKANAMWIGGSGPDPWTEMAGSLIRGGIGSKRTLSDDVGLIHKWFGTNKNKDKSETTSAAPPVNYGVQVPVKYTGMPPSPIPPPSPGIQIDGNPPSMKAIEDAAAAIAPKISIEVIMKNAPPGALVNARTKDGKNIPARVEYSMPSTLMP